MAQPATGGSAVNRDLGYKVRSCPSIPAKIGNDTTEGTGLSVDLKGYEGAVAVLGVGVAGDTLSGSIKVLCSVQDSANNSSWADLEAAQMRITKILDVSGSQTVTENSAFADIDAAAKDDVRYEVAILPGTGVNRYVRCLMTFTGTHTNGIPIYADIMRGFPRVEIAAAS
jgi:hypothetical protein